MKECSDVQGLSERIAIVTGGASGIGRATCQALARGGVRVVVVDLNPARIEKTLAELRDISDGPDGHLGLALNVSDEAAMAQMAQHTLDRFGRIDILVASAGILRGTGSSPKPLVQVSPGEWDQVLNTNLRGMFLSNRAVLHAMMQRHCGDIINISSVSGRQGRAHDAPYCASKAGVIGMSESLAEEVRSYGIRVQIVIPDAVRTPMWDQNGPIPCPADALPPARVADLIVYMLTQPRDSMLVGVTIAPFRARRRRQSKAAGGPAREEPGATAEGGVPGGPVEQASARSCRDSK